MLEVEVLQNDNRFSNKTPKVEKFPGLRGYPSHFGIDLTLSEDQITSIVHHVNLLLLAIPPDFQTPLWNLLAYIAHIKDSPAEATKYYRTVLKIDPHNIVATADLAHRAQLNGMEDEKAELEQKLGTWLSEPHSVKKKYVAICHLDIAFFYFYAGLRQASKYHLTTALQTNPTCFISRFYYSLFSYLSEKISYHTREEVTFHTSSLAFVSTCRPNVSFVNDLLWIIETKAVFLRRDKIAVLEDKLENKGYTTSCPFVCLLVAKELYQLDFYQAAMEQSKRSLEGQISAPAHYLLALCQKKLYEKDLEELADVPQLSSCEDATDTIATSRQVVIEETQHDSKHVSSARLLPVKSIDQVSCLSGRTKASVKVKESKDSEQLEQLTISQTSTNIDDDGDVDPRIADMFENIRTACILDPFEVSQLILLTEILVICRKMDLAILYLHEALRKCPGGEKVMTYLRLAVCYLDQRNAEQAALYLRLYNDNGGPETEHFLNLVVKLADIFMKEKHAVHARQWIAVMERHRHPSSEHFIQRLRRLVPKDKFDLLEGKTGKNSGKKGPGAARRKGGAS